MAQFHLNAIKILTVIQILLSGHFLFASVVGTEEPNAEKISLNDILCEALKKNPSVASSWRKWKAMRARIRQENAWEDPQVSYGMTAERFVTMMPNAMADQTFLVEQEIPVSGKNLSRGRIAAAQALVTFEEFRRKQLDLMSSVRIAYFRLLNVRYRLVINKENTASLRQIATIAQAKYQVGRESAQEALAAEIETAKLDEERSELQNMQSEAETQLNILMDHAMGTPIGELAATELIAPKISENNLMVLLLRARPEVRIAQAKIAVNKARLQLAKRGWIPDPAINVNVQRFNGASQTVSQLGVGISFHLPWGNAGKYSAAVREAHERIAAANSGFHSIKAESFGLLHDQLQRINTARHHYELFKNKILPDAKQAFKATELSYEAGKASFASWISAERSLREVQVAVSNRFTAYETAIAKLDDIVGMEIPTSFPNPRDMHQK